MPPHTGHLALIEFASRLCDELTVVVGTLPDEPIPGELRYRWMNELCPAQRVLHLKDPNPSYPHQHPDFWTIWRDSLQRICKRPIDLVFASEEYGEPLARVLNAQFVPNNAGRDLLPVSGTAVRAHPEAYWSYLPPVVRAYYARRVLLFGPESTGKTTLGKALAEHFGGCFVPEYARTCLLGHEETFRLVDLDLVAAGQVASEEAMARYADRPLLFCDTDPLITELWSMELFGAVSDAVRQLALQSRHDLILLLDVDIPWVADPMRYRPNRRVEFMQACREALERQGKDYVLIQGEGEQRTRQAIRAVEKLLNRPFDPARRELPLNATAGEANLSGGGTV